MRVAEFFGRVGYFLKVWVYVMMFLSFCYFGVIIANGLMDWVVTFTEEQIIVGVLVFAATVTAATMTWLNWLRIV